MRHAILALPTFLFLACSSGGPGTPTVDTPGGFGVEGSSIPVFGAPPSGGGSQTGGGTHDTGIVENNDTGSGGQDTGTVSTDTGGGSSGDDALCAAKCPSDPDVAASTVSSCKTLLGGTKCVAEYRAYLTCYKDNRVCTSEGMTDSAATASACSSESMAASTCFGG